MEENGEGRVVRGRGGNGRGLIRDGAGGDARAGWNGGRVGMPGRRRLRMDLRRGDMFARGGRVRKGGIRAMAD